MRGCRRVTIAHEAVIKVSRLIRRLILLTIMLCCQLARPLPSNGAVFCDPWVAKMVSVQGVVEVRRAGQTQWVSARLNDVYCGGDQIQVGEKSRADITLIN